MESIKERRRWLRAIWDELLAVRTDQQLRKPYPPLEQPYPADAELIALAPPERLSLGALPLRDAIARRESRRRFSAEPLALNELAFLLWATQGVRGVPASEVATLRTVPSGGSRHTFETYLALSGVEGLAPGLYRYIALKHALWQVRELPDIAERITAACLGQRSAGRSAVTFVWSSVPYRSEWRYAMAAHKMIAIDAGHVCQNLYLACEALALGCCAIGAYDQQLMDELLGIDGVDELAVYAAIVGKL